MNRRVPAVPLITCDPYFSIWSPADMLSDADTCLWTGRSKPITGHLELDGHSYGFMGRFDLAELLTQTSLNISPTASTYTFAGHGVELTVKFWTPLLLDDLNIMSRPCSYIDFSVISTDGAAHDAKVVFRFDESLCYDGENRGPMCSDIIHAATHQSSWTGKLKQTPLGHSGDNISIDWGYLYLTAPASNEAAISFPDTYNGRLRLVSETPLTVTAGGTPGSGYVVASYDDLASIFYFGRAQPGYWARNGKTILQAIDEAVAEHDQLLARCQTFDQKLNEEAGDFAPSYAQICALAYRQVIAAHKLIADEHGEAAFISKECFSNGCAATVDVSYPSVPLFLLYNPELVKAMLRPVLRFAKLPVWNFDFAPHDVGRYPYCNGQVYGLMQTNPKATTNGRRTANGDVYPNHYILPAGSNVYDLKYQMPVEECGNMLIMAAALIKAGDEASFAEANMGLYEKWVKYLMTYGEDPGEQLCTDDFAGHLAHNVNLSAKAIMGIASYAILLRAVGRENEADVYDDKAKELATSLLARASAGDHTRLTFDTENGWSLKYNTVWDLLFGTGLFPKEFYQAELNWYKKKTNRYGMPLDSRAEYTKSDWIMWCASMSADKGDVEAFAQPLVKFLEETPDRVPFSDWFETVTAVHHSFQNRTVQGGLFMPILAWRR